MSLATASHDHAAPSVSVVVPSYNHAPFVAATLRSIFRQRLAPRELLVIDDGSTDDSPRVIEETLALCPFPCEFIPRENRGLCRTLNEGLARTSGRYFAYVGSDDVWFPDFLAARVSALDARSAAVLAYGNAYHIDARDEIIDCTRDWAAYQDGDARRMLLTTLAPLSPTVVYRREAVARYGWNERARLEDYELYLRLSHDGEFAFDEGARAAWREHGYNTSRDLALMMEERLAAQERQAALLGVGQDELRRLQTLALFRSAEEFMRRGERRTVFRLLRRGGAGGAPSPLALARLLAGTLLPHALLRRRKARLREQARLRYGSLTEFTS